MKLAIIGTGNTGSMISELAPSQGHEISFKINSANQSDWSKIDSKNTDVIIEFTSPTTAISHIQLAFEKQIPIVCGTTGWHHALPDIQELAKKYFGTLIYGNNFSIGVHILFTLNKQLARIMNDISGYTLQISETHHVRKKDAPSGTAISLSQQIITQNKNYQSWVKTDQNVQADQIPISSIRLDDVPGTHVIQYTSEIDQITLQHIAFNRKGFALGAIRCAELIVEKGIQGVHSVEDLLKLE